MDIQGRFLKRSAGSWDDARVACEPNRLGLGRGQEPLFPVLRFFKQIAFLFVGYKFFSWASERSNSKS